MQCHATKGLYLLSFYAWHRPTDVVQVHINAGSFVPRRSTNARFGDPSSLGRKFEYNTAIGRAFRVPFLIGRELHSCSKIFYYDRIADFVRFDSVSSPRIIWKHARIYTRDAYFPQTSMVVSCFHLMRGSFSHL